MRKITLFLCILITHSLFAQKVFTIDTIHNQITGLPFDQKFTVKIKDPKKSMDSLSVHQLFIKNGEVVNKTCFRKEKKGIVIAPPRHVGKDAYISFPPMRPAQYYQIAINHKFKGKALDSLLSVFREFSGDSADRFNHFHNLSERLEPVDVLNKQGTAMCKFWLAAVYKDPTIPFSQKDAAYRDSVDNFFDTKIKTAFDDAIDLANTPDTNVVDSHLTEANMRLANSRYKAVDKTFDSYLTFYRAWSKLNHSDVFTGQVFIAFNSKKSKAYHIVKRASNLKASIKLIDKLLASTYAVLLLDTLQDSTYHHMIADFNTIRDQLADNKDFLDEKISSITTALDKERNMRYISWLSAKNEVVDLKTKGSYLMIPNIGVTSIITPDDERNFYRPFVGVSFHLRQVNKEIPLRELKNTLLHRLAFQVGLTVSEINDSEGEYFDLTNKMSLMTGLNFKITHAFGVSGGAVFMKRADPNPLINDKQNVVNGYIALTLDVDFANSLKSLTGKFGL